MPFKLIKYFFLLYFILVFSCKNPPSKTNTFFKNLKKDTNIKYAKRFSISSNNEITVIYLFGNKFNFDTTAIYIVYKDSVNIKNLNDRYTCIKSPCKKIAALSSIYASMFYELGLINNIVAIDNVDYFNNLNIIDRCRNNQINELIKGTEINIEQTIKLNPDAVFTFGMGNPKKDINPKLLQTHIPIVISLDHQEETPLARAEWLKFFAAFVNKKEKADSIFNSVEKSYHLLQSIAKKATIKPSVLSEIKYSDAWYVPGGKSYVAQLLKDAETNYIWANNLNYGSLPLSFEQVFAKAKNADFWINLSTLKTKQELKSFDSRYTEFKAFKNENLFNNNKTTNTKGYSTYWETGMIYPDRILSDFILIFHPELKEKIKNNLCYYQQLK